MTGLLKVNNKEKRLVSNQDGAHVHILSRRAHSLVFLFTSTSGMRRIAPSKIGTKIRKQQYLNIYTRKYKNEHSKAISEVVLKELKCIEKI